jgi:SAM-dependent methyltransferase
VTSRLRYVSVLARQEGSPTMRKIWRGVYGSDYPEAAEPFGFSTVTEHRILASDLVVAAGGTLVDVGCGRGGPGMWIAQQVRPKRFFGIDVDAGAVAAARRRRAGFQMTGIAEFYVGSSEDTRLAGVSVDGVVSVDVFWMVDKNAAVGEMARIIRPGGRLAFTTWEPEGAFRYESLLVEHGFSVVRCEEPDRWRERQSAVYDRILDSAEALQAELGPEAAGVLTDEASRFGPALNEWRRLIVTAELL